MCIYNIYICICIYIYIWIYEDIYIQNILKFIFTFFYVWREIHSMRISLAHAGLLLTWNIYAFLRVRACVCVFVCMRACMCVCKRERVREHVTHVNEACHTYEWVMWHIWMSHVTHVNECCHTYESVMAYIWMSHVTCMDESCHTYGWVMSRIWMSHVSHLNKSFHTRM